MNFAKGALQVLGTLAPTVATAFGGPFAGAAVRSIETSFGFGDDKTPQQKEDAINQALLSGNPDALLKFKQSEEDFTATMTKLGIEKDDLVYKDIDSARQMQVQTKDPTPRELSWVLVLGFILMVLGLVAGIVLLPAKVAGIPKEAWALLGTLVGWLAKGASQVETFWFGSSLGSKNKDQVLGDIAKQ